MQGSSTVYFLVLNILIIALKNTHKWKDLPRINSFMHWLIFTYAAEKLDDLSMGIFQNSFSRRLGFFFGQFFVAGESTEGAAVVVGSSPATTRKSRA